MQNTTHNMQPQQHHRQQRKRRHEQQEHSPAPRPTQPEAGHFDVSPSSSSSSSGTRVAIITSRQGYTPMETETAFPHADPRQGHPMCPRNPTQANGRHLKPWIGTLHLENPALTRTQLFDETEPSHVQNHSKRIYSQSHEESSNGRPSKRHRGEHAPLPLPPSPPSPNFSGTGPSSLVITTRPPSSVYSAPPPSSFNNTNSSNHLVLSTRSRASSVGTEVDRPTTAPASSINSTNNDAPPPELMILDANLWAQFHEKKNEMIITTNGRCLFPSLQFKIHGLDPDSYYSMRLDFEEPAPNRFRFYNGEWKPVGPLRHVDNSLSAGHPDLPNSTDRAVATAGGHMSESYTHPDKFQLGSHWMASPISFAKVKLANKTEPKSNFKNANKSKVKSTSTTKTSKTTNTTKPSKPKDDPNSTTSSSSISNDGHEESRQRLVGANDINSNVFHMTSFHKYCPRIYLTQCAKDSDEIINTTVYRFDETEFMAVTRYQNENVNDLKKSHNPHARAFRDAVGQDRHDNNDHPGHGNNNDEGEDEDAERMVLSDGNEGLELLLTFHQLAAMESAAALALTAATEAAQDGYHQEVLYRAEHENRALRAFLRERYGLAVEQDAVAFARI